MMYGLVWRDTALETLADLYLAVAPERRDRMAGGVESLNARLRTDPLDVGESRGGRHRLAFPPLLMVLFRVDTANRVVLVTRVARYGR